LVRTTATNNGKTTPTIHDTTRTPIADIKHFKVDLLLADKEKDLNISIQRDPGSSEGFSLHENAGCIL